MNTSQLIAEIASSLKAKMLAVHLTVDEKISFSKLERSQQLSEIDDILLSDALSSNDKLKLSNDTIDQQLSKIASDLSSLFGPGAYTYNKRVFFEKKTRSQQMAVLIDLVSLAFQVGGITESEKRYIESLSTTQQLELMNTRLQ